MKYYLGFFIFICLACSTPQKPPASGPLLFPDGRYTQDAEVFISVPEKQDFDFNCIVQKGPKEFLFFGYNSFGISLFKIHQKAGEAVVAESSIDQINKNKDFFLKIFDLVKAVLSLEKADFRIKNDQIQLKVRELETLVKFTRYNEWGVPKEMLIASEGKYKVVIKTTSYESMMETNRH